MFLCERDRASPLLGRFLVLPACFSYTQVPQRARHHLCTVSIACQCMHGTSILLAAAVRVLHGWEPEAAGSLAISTNTLCLPLFPGLLPTRRRHQHCVPITGECCRPFAFLLVACVAAASGWFVWRWVPETKGKSLVEVQALMMTAGT